MSREQKRGEEQEKIKFTTQIKQGGNRLNWSKKSEGYNMKFKGKTMKKKEPK